MKLREVEAGRGEEWQPIGRPGRLSWVRLFLWGDGLEIKQTAFWIELNINHAGEDGGRVRKGDDIGSEGRPPKAIGAHFSGALPATIQENRWLFGKQPLPVRLMRRVHREVRQTIGIIIAGVGVSSRLAAVPN